MSELLDSLKGAKSSDVLAFIKEQAMTDPAFASVAKGMGIDIETPKEPKAVLDLLNEIADTVRERLGDMDEDQIKKVRGWSPAFKLEIMCDTLNGEAHIFERKSTKIEGSAGSGNTFLDADGNMFATRVAYLHAQGEHVSTGVVSRQTKDLVKAVLDDNGVPRWKWDSKAKDHDYKGEELSDDFVQKIKTANNL